MSEHSILAKDDLSRTAYLLLDGGKILHELRSKVSNTTSVRFQDWSQAVISRTSDETQLVTNDQLVWIWESLRRAPSLQHLFWDLPSATVPWSSKADRFFVFPPGQLFFIGMNGEEVSGLLSSSMFPELEDRVTVLTEEPLRMRPGKLERLECSDCKSIVKIRVEQTFGIEREADIMRIDANRILVEGNFIKVHVDSLNQAYTVASRRLEPKRRSHGGRTYDHLVHVDKGSRRKLEAIRYLVETGSWRPDSLTEQQIVSLFVEPKQWGLRGDPYLWRELRQRVLDYGITKSIEKFESELSTLFKDLAGVVLDTNQETVFVDRYDKGGMSSGHISPEWWREIALPLLRERFLQLTPVSIIPTSKACDESN